MDRAASPRPIGIIASTRYGCFETDLAFHATAEEENGIYASPNLFSYTLPGMAVSEAAIHFQLTGPTFTVGDPVGQRGYRAVDIAVDLVSSGICPTILAGWLDVGNRLLKHNVADDDGVRGAVFVVLSTGYEEKPIHKIRQEDAALFMESGTAGFHDPGPVDLTASSLTGCGKMSKCNAREVLRNEAYPAGKRDDEG